MDSSPAVLLLSTWTPHVGDATVGGWLIAAAYLVAALLALRARWAAMAGAHESLRPRTRERRARSRERAYRAAILFWTVVMAGLVLLGLNKQLDLHSWATEVGRNLARDHGWYGERRAVQRFAVWSLAVVSVVGLAGLLWATRCILPRQALALSGMVVVGGFVLARAASFHHLDDFFALDFAGVRTRMVVEGVGIGLIGGCAWMNTRWLKSMRAHSATR